MLKFTKFCQLLEDGVPATCSGGGAVAGLGIGPDGEPGVKPKKKRTKSEPVLRGVVSTIRVGE